MIFEKHIWKFYKKYALFFLIGIAALIFVDWIQLKIPEYFGEITRLLEGKGKVPFTDEETKLVGNVALKTLGVAALMMTGRIAFRYSIFYASHKMETDLRQEMFEKAERLPTYYYHVNTVGTVMAWFTNDIDTIEEYFGWGTVMLIDGVFLSVMVMVKMFVLKWQFALILLLPVCLIIVWGLLVEQFMDKAWNRRQKAFDELYDFSQEAFTGIRVIKAFVKERQQLRAFSKVARKNENVNVKFVKLHTMFDVVIEVLIALIFTLVYGLGAWFVYKTNQGSEFLLFGNQFSLKLDELLEILLYFDSLIWPLIALGQIVAMKARSKASLKRIAAFLEAPEEIHDCENPVVLKNIDGEIEFKDFSFTYPDSENGEPYLKNISLKINKGESIGVVGKIGSGKTSLVNVLLRLYNVNENSLFIDGIDIMKCSISSLRDNIAYVPQDNFLFGDTIHRNIAFSDPDMPINTVKRGAIFSDVHDDIEAFPDKYETVTGERGVSLSGGQKQRISIARAFVKDSPILIFDDSVSAVDIKTEENILKNIKMLREGKTTIVVASRISTVNHLDKIIVLKDGELEAFGTPEELSKISKTYQKMVYLQKLQDEVEGGCE